MSSTRALVSAASQGCPQLVGELALLFDGGQHGLTTLVELTQVTQALLERAQLAVVEAAGDLLAVPGDERDRRALVQELDGCGYLPSATPSSSARRAVTDLMVPTVTL